MLLTNLEKTKYSMPAISILLAFSLKTSCSKRIQDLKNKHSKIECHKTSCFWRTWSIKINVVQRLDTSFFIGQIELKNMKYSVQTIIDSGVAMWCLVLIPLEITLIRKTGHDIPWNFIFFSNSVEYFITKNRISLTQ